MIDPNDIKTEELKRHLKVAAAARFAFVVLAIGLCSTGAALIYFPAGLITAGVMFLGVALIARR